MQSPKKSLAGRMPNAVMHGPMVHDTLSTLATNFAAVNIRSTSNSGRRQQE
jgi:hypothetical protein